MTIEKIKSEAINLLKNLIIVRSYSGEEAQAADTVQQFLEERGILTERLQNNVWAKSKLFDKSKQTVLLNSHLDTVKSNKNWTRDPFGAESDGDKLYGLGSNDAGGPLVSLLAAFLYFYDRELPYNLIFAATAEEEVSGENGMILAFPRLGDIDLAIIGEPSDMALTIAERGHMTLEVVARGRSGHAARDNGENAIIKALPDIQWFQDYEFNKVSELLGPVKMTVTMIEAGTSSNAVPDECRFVVDVRTTDVYENEEVLETIQEHLLNEIRPLSRHLKASRLPVNHPLISAARASDLGIVTSPTSSDQGLIDIPSVKIGPGKSERSHTSDEYIRISEIREGIDTFIQLLNSLQL